MLNALRGDFGTSYVYAMPVSSLLHGKLGVTALLTAIAFVLIVAVSLPVGLFAASRQGGWLDRALTVLGQVVMAVPPFVVGILLTRLSLRLRASGAAWAICSIRRWPSPCPASP